MLTFTRATPGRRELLGQAGHKSRSYRGNKTKPKRHVVLRRRWSAKQGMVPQHREETGDSTAACCKIETGVSTACCKIETGLTLHAARCSRPPPDTSSSICMPRMQVGWRNAKQTIPVRKSGSFGQRACAFMWACERALLSDCWPIVGLLSAIAVCRVTTSRPGPYKQAVATLRESLYTSAYQRISVFTACYDSSIAAQVLTDPCVCR